MQKRSGVIWPFRAATLKLEPLIWSNGTGTLACRGWCIGFSRFIMRCVAGVKRINCCSSSMFLGFRPGVDSIRQFQTFLRFPIIQIVTCQVGCKSGFTHNNVIYFSSCACLVRWSDSYFFIAGRSPHRFTNVRERITHTFLSLATAWPWEIDNSYLIGNPNRWF